MTPEQFTAWREDRRWNQAEASRQLGCARNSVIAYETGKARIPRYIELACIALANNWQLAAGNGPQTAKSDPTS